MNKRLSLKVAKDMLWHQGSWTLAFLGIVLLVNLFNIVKGGIQGNEVDYYYNAVFVSSSIYMFVIGIIAIYFLPYYVENGVPRKHYFTGVLLAAIALAVMIPIISFLISWIEQLVIHFPFKEFNVLNETVNDMEDSLIGYIVGSFVMPPYVDPFDNWVLALSITSLNIFIYYMIGWFISICFYRFQTIPGLISIVFGVIVVMLSDSFMRHILHLPLSQWFTNIEVVPNSFSWLIILLLMIITLVAIQLIVKRTPIKI